MRPDPRVKAVYLYPKPVDFRKSINGLAALVELDIKVAVFDPVLFVILNVSAHLEVEATFGRHYAVDFSTLDMAIRNNKSSKRYLSLES